MEIDGTTLKLPDVEELRKEYGVLKRKEGQRESAKALGSCLYDVVNNWIVDAQIEKINISERDLAQRHIIELVQLFSEMGLEKQLKKVRTLAGTCIRVGTLTANGQATTMTKTTIATDLHEALNILRNFAMEVTLSGEVLLDVVTKLGKFIFSQIVNARVWVNTSFSEDLLGGG